MNTAEIRHFHLFCGLGGGAAGFQRGRAEVPGLQARFRCIGGVDVDPAGIADFGRLAGVPGTLLDLFDREQYEAFHGHRPPADWREAGPDQIRQAAGGERPHIVFLSAPCKGFSGLLSEAKSKSARYQALNRLTLRGIWLMLEAWADDPPELVLFENVPRIQTRGRQLLDQITSLLQAYGYAVAETTHDCGELGGLAQSRKRFLFVARHAAKVPNFLYEPPRRPLRAVGELLDRMPLPGALDAGGMHRVPNLQWRTWVRLAFVEAGGDWRSLARLEVVDGHLRNYLVLPVQHGGNLGVCAWAEATGTVTGRGTPTTGKYSVADPRYQGLEYCQYGVKRWDQTSGAVSGQSAAGGGAYSVADPRIHGVRHNNIYRVVRWDHASQAVTGGPRPSSGGLAIADPRSGLRRANGDSYLTAGHYGVIPWHATCGAVSAAAGHDNGRWSVADPRVLPGPDERLFTRIIAEDGTWHRPFTTLELAVLQGLLDPEEHLELEGMSDSAWRERIGNAVPPPAAEAIAGVMGRTLLLAWTGQTFQLSNAPVWVRPLVAALAAGGQVQ